MMEILVNLVRPRWELKGAASGKVKGSGQGIIIRWMNDIGNPSSRSGVVPRCFFLARFGSGCSGSKQIDTQRLGGKKRREVA
jgi:hypothetical protein